MARVKSPKIATFFSQFPSRTFSQGEILLRPESELKEIYYLKTGKVRMYTLTADGIEVTLHIFRPFSYFPLMFILASAPNPYFFEVLEPTVLAVAPSSQVVDFLTQEKDILLELTTSFCRALLGLLIRVETLAGENAYTRLGFLLLYLADRFGQKKDPYVTIALSLSHDDIARWIGLRRETVSRQFEKLQEQQLVTVNERKQIVVNVSQLRLFISRN